MDLEEIKTLTEKALEEIENPNLEDSLPVPHGSEESGKTFRWKDVMDCYSKPFAVREMIYLVGSTSVHPDEDAHDVDLVILMKDMPDNVKEGTLFRLYRAFSEYFNVPYDDVPQYLHIEFKEPGTTPYTSWTPLYKWGLISPPEKERFVHQMEGLTLAKSSEDWIVYGYGSIDVIDLEGDEITLDTLKEMWEELKKTPKKFWNVMNEHEGIQVGEILLEWNDLKTHVDDNGFFVIVKLRKDIEAAQKVWAAIHAEIEEDCIKSFSIHIEYPGGVVNCTERTCDENRCWRKITKARFLEVSFTMSPANPLCLLKPATQIDTNSKELPLIRTSE